MFEKKLRTFAQNGQFDHFLTIEHKFHDHIKEGVTRSLVAGKPQIFAFFWTVLVPKVTKILLKFFFSKILGPPLRPSQNRDFRSFTQGTTCVLEKNRQKPTTADFFEISTVERISQS